MFECKLIGVRKAGSKAGSKAGVNEGVLRGGVLGTLCPGMNPEIGEMPRHSAHLYYDVYREVNFA